MPATLPAIAGPLDHIVLCTDGSLLGPETAVSLLVAGLTGARLQLAHVPHGGARADDVLSEVVRRDAADLEADVIILPATSGSPAGRLITHLAGVPASMACMATHGLPAVGQLAFGSVTSEVIRDGQMPVLICGPKAVAPDTLSRVVACTDGSVLAAGILPAAAGLARDLGVPLWLLQVIDRDDVPAGADIAETTMVQGLADEVRTWGIVVEWDVLRGSNAADAITAYVNDEAGTVTALATHGRSGLVGTLTGSVARSITRKAHGPVLVRRPLMADGPRSPLPSGMPSEEHATSMT